MAKIKSQKKKKEQQPKKQEDDVVVLPSTRSSDDPIPNRVSSIEFHMFHCDFCKHFFFFIIIFWKMANYLFDF